MRVDERGRLAGQRTVTMFHASTDVAAEYDELLHRRRSQRRNRAAALAASAVVALLAVISLQANLAADHQPQPMKPLPGMDIGGVPVWYDDAGLHRGNIVEQTPVELRQLNGKDIADGALALVRTGALYLDPATGDVWFHPWGGDPRIVGQDSETGPSADPSGDVAVWLEAPEIWIADPELVVYDTAAGREISRTRLSHKPQLPDNSNTSHSDGVYDQPGNDFLQVSAERVGWLAVGAGPVTFDVRTGKVSFMANLELVDGPDGEVVDVHDAAAVYAVGDALEGWHLALDMPGRTPQEYPEVDAYGARFSPSSNYVASVVGGARERHSAAIIDTRTGELWPVPQTGGYWSAWSYGDIALVQQGDELLACDAVLRTCETLPAEPPFLMPTN